MVEDSFEYEGPRPVPRNKPRLGDPPLNCDLTPSRLPLYSWLVHGSRASRWYLPFTDIQPKQ